METIKINETQFELVSNGYQLGNDGGQVIFQPGAASFDEVEALLMGTKSLTVLDSTGEPLISRSDLVYAGQLTKDSNYVIGAEQVQTGTDGDGNPVYEMRDKIGTVLIAQFRTPDLREKCAELEAQMAYLAMMTDVEMEA